MLLVDRVRRTIRRHDLVPVGARLVAAVSGGPDSVALVHLLRALDERGDLHLVAIAHLNHQLRADAIRDEELCQRIARSLSVPFVAERADVGAVAASRRVSVETAAHDVRHAFFERARTAHAADLVALGHTRDDQAETFLLRLTRGAGARGLGGMHPRAGALVRPLLDCRRFELRAYLEAAGVPYVHDPSNDDVSIPRNRIRAELLPLLESRFNPRIVDALARASDLVRADQEYLDAQAAEYWAGHARPERDGWSLDRDDLAARPIALRRRVLLLGMHLVAPDQSVGFDHVERAVALLGPGGKAVEVPGCRLQRDGRLVVIRSRPPAARQGPGSSTSASLQFRYELRIPGEVRVAEVGCVVSAELHGGATSALLALTPDRGVVVPAALVGAGGRSLTVRNRRPGDRVRPGRGGSRKLQDVFVDRKVPRLERDRIPVVVDADDRIIWVAGHVFSQEFRVTDPAQAVVVLRLKGVGGSC